MEKNRYFDQLRVKLERDFQHMNRGRTPVRVTSCKPKQSKNFTFFSSEKKLPSKEEREGPESSKIKRNDPHFLTPLLIRNNLSNLNEKDNLGQTHWKSETKSQRESNSPQFLTQYLNVNGLRPGSLQDVFDVLRLENPDFKVIDNKIRTLLCLIKTLVVRAVMIENGNKAKNPELGKLLKGKSNGQPSGTSISRNSASTISSR